jgi:FkbM family methyltransferase
MSATAKPSHAPERRSRPATGGRPRLRWRKVWRDLRRLARTNPPGRVARYAWLVLRRREARIVLNVAGETLTLRTCTPDLHTAHTCFSGEYTTALAHVGTRHRLIVDAGGYIGTAARVFATAFPGSTVICLEPSPENAALARANTADLPNVRVWPLALAAAPGQVTLSDRATGAWGYTILPSAADTGPLRALARVEAIDMPTLLARVGADGADLVKLDIEGAERDVLADAPAWVAACDVLVVELHDRVAPGCTAAFAHATAGRDSVPDSGEKRISIRPRVSASASARPPTPRRAG